MPQKIESSPQDMDGAAQKDCFVFPVLNKIYSPFSIYLWALSQMTDSGRFVVVIQSIFAAISQLFEL